MRTEPPEGEDSNRDSADRHGAPVPVAAEASLRYGLQILGLFSSERPLLKIGEIAQELGLNPMDAHIQVSAMRRMNLVRERPGRHYGLGSGPRDLGLAAVRAAGIARRTRPYLIALHKATRCTVTLAMLDGTELTVANRPGAAGTRAEMTIELDRRAPAHATALGKVLLAYLPESREHALVQALQTESCTPRTITCKRKLLSHLQQVRSEGIALEDREHMPHKRCLAAPVRGACRQVVAAVGLTLSEQDESMQRHSPELLRSARLLSGVLQNAPVDWPEL